jgi:peptide-methionine (R)-S-oxide reductase
MSDERPLTDVQRRILKEQATERPGSSPLNHEKRAGLYRCAGCGAELFDSDVKYESGSGWPSFYQARPGAVATRTDSSHGMARTEAVCAKCGGHLGHLFDDGPQPTGMRYCMNGAVLDFEPEAGNKA